MCSKHIGGHEFDLSWSRDTIGHVTVRFPIGHFLLMVRSFGTKALFLTVSEIFDGECDAMVHMMTLNDL